MHKFNKAVFIIKTAEENRQTCLELYNINITAISKKKKIHDKKYALYNIINK